MKTKLQTLAALIVMMHATAFAQRDCGTMQNLERIKAADPKFEQKMMEYENNLQKVIADKASQKSSNVVITIPVVVHVVYNNNAQNISNAQVLSQIDVLNEDFGRTNADTINTPAAFQGVAANTQVQFCLAQRDPFGNPTTGIERRQTSVTSFNTNDAVKFYNQGGLDAWDVTQYMNIWVCNLSGGLLGYGEFPTSTPSNTFGVVVAYDAFGRVGNVVAPFNLGRTCTHEFSHCFNLFHIWGDDGGSCSGSDLVSDTPNQADATTGCFTFPKYDACTASGNGIMFMNYMIIA
jgi:hypothetical protein